MVSACPLHVQSCWWRLHLSTHRFLNVAASFSLVKKNTKMDNHGQLEISMIAPGWTEFHDLHDLSCLACSCQSYICSLAAPSSLAGSSISDTKESKQANVCSFVLSNEEERLLELNTIAFCLELLCLNGTCKARTTHILSKGYFQDEMGNKDNCLRAFSSCYDNVLRQNFFSPSILSRISGMEWSHLILVDPLKQHNQDITHRHTHTYIIGTVDWWLKALAALERDTGSISSSHIVAHNLHKC